MRFMMSNSRLFLVAVGLLCCSVCDGLSISENRAENRTEAEQSQQDQSQQGQQCGTNGVDCQAWKKETGDTCAGADCESSCCPGYICDWTADGAGRVCQGDGKITDEHVEGIAADLQMALYTLDLDGDGLLSLEELPGDFHSQYDKIDPNGDGIDIREMALFWLPFEGLPQDAIDRVLLLFPKTNQETSITEVASKKKGNQSECFPGTSITEVATQGPTYMAKAREGDMVLVDNQGEMEFQPIMAFLHVVRGMINFVTVSHVHGKEAFRASGNHLIFNLQKTAIPSARLKIGDEILTNKGELRPSMVLSVGRGQGQGMYAPLTFAGSIIVDGVSASNYATANSMDFSHQIAHIGVFPLRTYHQFGFAEMFSLSGQGQKTTDMDAMVDDVHPFAQVFWKRMPIDGLISSVSRGS